MSTNRAARRMARQGLIGRGRFVEPAEVVGLMCGAHAQVLSAAELSIGRRLAGGASGAVQHAFGTTGR